MLTQSRRLLSGLGTNWARTWIGLVFVVAIGLAAGAVLRRALARKQAPSAAELAYRFVPGERWRYRLRYSGSGIVDMNPFTGGGDRSAGDQMQSVQTVVEGELVMDVLDRDDRRTLVAYSLPKAEVVLSVSGQPLLESAEAV